MHIDNGSGWNQHSGPEMFRIEHLHKVNYRAVKLLR